MIYDEYLDKQSEYISDSINEEIYEEKKEKLQSMDLSDVISLLPDEVEEEFRNEILNKCAIPTIDLMDFLNKDDYDKMVDEIIEEVIRLGLTNKI